MFNLILKLFLSLLFWVIAFQSIDAVSLWLVGVYVYFYFYFYFENNQEQKCTLIQRLSQIDAISNSRTILVSVKISWKQFEFVFLTFYGDEIYFRYPVTYVLYFVRLHLALWTNKFKNSFSDYENLTQPSSFYKKMLLIFSLDFYAILTFFRTPNIITNSRKFFEITFSMKVPTEAQNF